MWRAQLSLETIVAIGILLFFLIVSFGLLVQINLGSQTIRVQATEWNECSRLAGLIQEVFVQGPGTQIKTIATTNFDVASRSLYLGQTTCDFSAAVQGASLLDGNVLISNASGIVVVQNE